MRGFVAVLFRTLRPGWIMGMNVHVMPVTEGCIVVFVNFHDRHSCTGNSQHEQGQNYPAATPAGCTQSVHSAPTVPDSH